MMIRLPEIWVCFEHTTAPALVFSGLAYTRVFTDTSHHVKLASAEKHLPSLLRAICIPFSPLVTHLRVLELISLALFLSRHTKNDG